MLNDFLLEPDYYKKWILWNAKSTPKSISNFLEAMNIIHLKKKNAIKDLKK